MKIDVKKVAKLANLNVKDKDLPKLEIQLEAIVKYVDKLYEVDTKDVDITSQIAELENITRKDLSIPSLTQKEALSGTKSKHNGNFKVDAILENE